MTNYLICRAGIFLLAALFSLAALADAPTPARASPATPLTRPGARPASELPSRWLAQAGDGVISDPAAKLGEDIYLRGAGVGGRLLTGTRADGAALSGPEAACVQCHRRSGLGQVEGQLVVPPITGHALFQEQGGLVLMTDTRSRKSWNTHHAPYDSASLAQVLRTGQSVEGRPLEAVMPRYTLDAQEQAGLEAYLRQLSLRWSPGATQRTISLATVLTPEIQGERRRIVHEMVHALVSRHNLATAPGRRHMAGATQFVLKTERQWIHHFWELEGPPETWEAQLEAFQAREPVFALVSGAGRDWRPVDHFCARNALPCWFPSAPLPAVEASPGARADLTLHFSRGVLVEAEVLADALAQLPPGAEVRQWSAPGDGAAAAAAAALTQRLVAAGRPAPDAARFAAPGEAVGPAPAEESVLVCWCAPDALQALLKQAPPARTVVVSGTLLDGATLVPETLLGAAAAPAWRAALRVVQPYALPEVARANDSVLRNWLDMVKLPLVDEALQSEVFFAFGYLAETCSEMLNNLHREYLVERGSVMLERREQLTAAAEVRAAESLRAIVLRPAAGDAPASAGDAPARSRASAPHDGTTVYPRLSLSLGQRFASRGAQLLRADAPDGQGALSLRSDLGWVVP